MALKNDSVRQYLNIIMADTKTLLINIEYSRHL
jgi:hypothetical protein